MSVSIVLKARSWGIFFIPDFLQLLITLSQVESLGVNTRNLEVGQIRDPKVKYLVEIKPQSPTLKVALDTLYILKELILRCSGYRCSLMELSFEILLDEVWLECSRYSGKLQDFSDTVDGNVDGLSHSHMILAMMILGIPSLSNGRLLGRMARLVAKYYTNSAESWVRRKGPEGFLVILFLLWLRIIIARVVGVGDTSLRFRGGGREVELYSKSFLPISILEVGQEVEENDMVMGLLVS
ncbi:hypothetical protein Tco_0693621 [Tanacetum coccineum]